jgi:hypothetical protein
MVTSGCFQIRKATQDPATLDLNEIGKVVLHLYQVSRAEQSDSAYVFILVGYEKEDIKLRTVRRFDLWGNYGGPLSKTTDPALEALLLTEGHCYANGFDASELTDMTNWRAYRTASPIDMTAFGTDDPMKIVLKFERIRRGDGEAFPSLDDERGDFVIFSGVWSDGWGGTPDGVPDSGETACAGIYFSSFSDSEGVRLDP